MSPSLPPLTVLLAALTVWGLLAVRRRGTVPGWGSAAFAVLFNSHERPIPSPVENLRPARDTCEQCHWPEKFHGDIESFVERNYPAWRIIGSGSLSRPNGQDASVSVLIEEDPRYKELSYVHPELNLEFRRQVSQGQVTLDDEVLQEEDPELWEEITEERRVPKDLDQLTAEQVAKLAAYLIRSKPTVKLAAPKKPKDD